MLSPLLFKSLAFQYFQILVNVFCVILNLNKIPSSNHFLPMKISHTANTGFPVGVRAKIEPTGVSLNLFFYKLTIIKQMTYYPKCILTVAIYCFRHDSPYSLIPGYRFSFTVNARMLYTGI